MIFLNLNFLFVKGNMPQNFKLFSYQSSLPMPLMNTLHKHGVFAEFISPVCFAAEYDSAVSLALQIQTPRSLTPQSKKTWKFFFF
jgi:hypothetical protein